MMARFYLFLSDTFVVMTILFNSTAEVCMCMARWLQAKAKERMLRQMEQL